MAVTQQKEPSPTMQDLSDEHLLKATSQSDHGAFTELHNRYWHELYRLAFRKIGDVDDTGNLLQDLFLEFWEKREEWKMENGVRNWLRNRLWYKIMMYFRTKGFNKRHLDEFAAFMERESQHEASTDILVNREESADREEILRAIDACIADMPNRMKVIFTMNRVDGLSYGEIADTLNVSPETVKAQLQRGMKRLRTATRLFDPRIVKTVLLLLLTNHP